MDSSEFFKIIALFRRNRVHAAATKSWPGNVIPTFKGPKCKDIVILLDKLVEDLLPHCSYSGWGHLWTKWIRQHILDTLNKRRSTWGTRL